MTREDTYVIHIQTAGAPKKLHYTGLTNILTALGTQN